LEHCDGYRWLGIFSGGEGFRTLGWDRGVALDELGHDATLGLDSEAQWGYVN
jgi:hypothetical protein